METNNEMNWVDERLSALEPAWSANMARGSELLDAGLRRRAPFRLWIPAAAAAAVCIAVALPQTRAVAQQLWNHFILSRVDVVRVDFSDLPLNSEISNHGMPQRVRDLDEAERLAGYRPFVPATGMPSEQPSFTVLGATDFTQVIHVAALRAALQKAGVDNVTVPPEWEGVQLRYSISPMVNAGYKDDVGILQAKPIEFSIPNGFPLQRFAEIAFRCVGLSERDAAAMAQKFTANPAWLLDVPADASADVEQVILRSGPALLVQEFNDDGRPPRVTVLRTTNDRIFAVETNSRQQALKIGDELP
ncbi:MAG TPA: hypothetical protein VGM43_10660 [Bryobacteraceae bacterium]|jgi:hypothetical protein